MHPSFPASPRLRPVRLLALAALLLPASLPGQTVRGRVVEAETGAPLPGAVVVLQDASGRRVAAVLADAEGRYRVSAPGAGTYRLRAERVGFANPAAATLTLADGETREHELRTASRRVVLDEVVAEGQRRRCAGQPQEGALAATVWDEARKALAAAALAQESAEYWFLSELRWRETGLNGRNLMRQHHRQVVTQGRPFSSAAVEDLVTGGYVVLAPRRVELKGVDPTAILSDLFVEHHCFGLRRAGPEQPGLIGLEFVPLEGRVEPDVEGVLWLDRATAELRYVEYRYTGLQFRGPADRLGGRIDFQRLPAGAWIIPAWTIRAPLLRMDNEPEFTLGSMRRFRMYGISEQGGRVLEIRLGDGTPVPLGR
ncbi:MAG TPA: carboxypeptidase-like regulatory domain-containing protein [Longimicrobium sp.]|nr:carboxypeptidase-like regulatory domain-containing protein [Longimicrobium sp.]